EQWSLCASFNVVRRLSARTGSVDSLQRFPHVAGVGACGASRFTSGVPPSVVIKRHGRSEGAPRRDSRSFILRSASRLRGRGRSSAARPRRAAGVGESPWVSFLGFSVAGGCQAG